MPLMILKQYVHSLNCSLQLILYKPNTNTYFDKSIALVFFIFQHKTICHKRNFVSPSDPLVHTQNIEVTWRYAKKNYPENSTSEALRDSYLQEFVGYLGAVSTTT